jgi:hypothetical protein
MDVSIGVKGHSVSTSGLVRVPHPELRLQVSDGTLLGPAQDLLQFVVKYILDQGARISPEQTLLYGYWTTKFRRECGGALEVWEHNADATEFVPGASRALTYWRDQHLLCEKYGADFNPPKPTMLAAVSDGVLEGDAVEAVRYPSPEHMSGWWLTTNRYNGNIKSLKCLHLLHVTAARSDLVRYLALPDGYRFNLVGGERVWFDEAVAREPAN